MYSSVWYDSLINPWMSPPAYIFGPAWAFLYILIFLSLFIYIFSKNGLEKRTGYIIFGIQIFLNFIWSPVFFYFHNLSLAFIIIVLLDIFILLNIIEFKRVSNISAYLLIPYMIWVIFATYLNFGFLILN